MLINDTDSSLLSADPDTLDVVRSLAEFLELVVDGMSSLNSGLSVEFSRVGDLEEDILHDIGTERPLELERLSL